MEVNRNLNYLSFLELVDVLLGLLERAFSARALGAKHSDVDIGVSACVVTTSGVRLDDVFTNCVRGPEFKISARCKSCSH